MIIGPAWGPGRGVLARCVVELCVLHPCTEPPSRPELRVVRRSPNRHCGGSVTGCTCRLGSTPNEAAKEIP